MLIKKVGILYHPLKQEARELADELVSFLKSIGVSSWTGSAWEEEKAKGKLDGTDLLLTTGGDGTILHAAQVANLARIPITGINLGHLGFMTELNVEEAKPKLIEMIKGGGWIDERAMLEADIMEGGVSTKLHALNDVVVARGAIPRMVHLEANISGEDFTTYRVDGVIVATATGSTSYSLAVGGPILNPQAQEFLLVPISPHLSSNYPLVLPPAAVVELNVRTAHPAVVSVDGINNLPIGDGARIMIKSSARKTRFLRIHPPSFYGGLNNRLRGKDEGGRSCKSQDK